MQQEMKILTPTEEEQKFYNKIPYIKIETVRGNLLQFFPVGSTYPENFLKDMCKSVDSSVYPDNKEVWVTLGGDIKAASEEDYSLVHLEADAEYDEVPEHIRVYGYKQVSGHLACDYEHYENNDGFECPVVWKLGDENISCTWCGTSISKVNVNSLRKYMMFQMSNGVPLRDLEDVISQINELEL